MSKRNVLGVSFKAKEKDLIEFMEQKGHIDNFSYYVKNLIRNDMNKVEYEPIKPKENTKSVKRNTNYDME